MEKMEKKGSCSIVPHAANHYGYIAAGAGDGGSDSAARINPAWLNW